MTTGYHYVFLGKIIKFIRGIIFIHGHAFSRITVNITPISQYHQCIVITINITAISQYHQYIVITLNITKTMIIKPVAMESKRRAYSKEDIVELSIQYA